MKIFKLNDCDWYAAKDMKSAIEQIMFDMSDTCENCVDSSAHELTDEEITKLLNKDSQLNLKIESGKYLKNDDPVIDSIPWVVGITPNINTNGSVAFVKISQLIPKQAKTLIEARGLITADYQNYLEEKWLEELKTKYKVEINKEVLSAIE